MGFLELKLKCEEGYSEILIAELGVLGFDSMEETDGGFNAYIEADQLNEEALTAMIDRYKEQAAISYTFNTIKRENWNREWEKNYDPIVVDDKCVVQASFHDVEGEFDYRITINPKMSFGTGHHETTYQMLSHQMKMDHQGKRVMDAGCGTGILAIMAELRGAKEVDAFDIDDWCVENGIENLHLNKTDKIKIHKGDITQMNFDGQYDIILANINKNILLRETAHYSAYLKDDGYLVLSGFYQGDVEDLTNEASKHDLEFVERSEKNKWASVMLRKKEK